MINWSKFLKYDFKSFLKSLIEIKRRKNPLFSQRAMARSLNMAPSTLNEIINGKRPLTKKTIDKMKKVFADDPDLIEALNAHQEDPLNAWQSESPVYTQMVTSWYHEALQELTQTTDFNESPSWIAQRLGITEQEAQQTLENLMTIGVLKKGPSGRITPTFTYIFTDAENANGSLMKRAQSHLQKMESSIKELPYKERFLGNVIIAIDPEDFDIIRVKMADFLKKQVRFLGRAGTKKREVYMLSLGCVPLTHPVSGDRQAILP